MTIAIVQVFILRYSIQVLVMLRTSKTPHDLLCSLLGVVMKALPQGTHTALYQLGRYKQCYQMLQELSLIDN